MLILLSYLVKAPALPAKPSWLPAPIVILARTATNALHASPSSVRSRSSSVSCGRSRTDSTSTGTGRIGKGTPTSLRSFGRDCALSSGGGSGRRSVSSAAATEFTSTSGQHAAVDAEAAMEVSGCELTDRHSGKKHQ